MKDLNIEQVEPIKLSITDTIFYTNPKNMSVGCKIYFVIKGPNDVLNIINMFADEDCHEAVAEAHVNPEDVYDVETGKRIARAKAESLAYKKVNKLFSRICGRLTCAAISFMEFNEKSESVVNHNDEYLSRF